MTQRVKLTLLISLAAVLILSACSGNSETADWKAFSIDQEPALNIEFRLPPRWLVDYAPSRNKPGQWEIILIPPKCSPEQEVEYQQNCVILVAYIKDETSFSKETFFEVNSADIPLSQDGTQSALLLDQESYSVNRLKVEQFNHLIATSLGDVQMSTYFFETDSAYFTFITNFPYSEAENEAVDTFELLLGSLKRTR